MQRSPAATGALARLVLSALVLVLAGCQTVAPNGFSGDVEALLRQGQEWSASLRAASSGPLEEPDLVALGYLERARLGLGSPFRTVEYLLRDPLVDEASRERLAYAVLGQVLDGATYRVDPAILASLELGGSWREEGGVRQLRLLEGTVDVAPNAAAGERAIRLGYQLAGAERTVAEAGLPTVAHLAGMVGDRRRAREDAVRLLRAASQAGRDPLELLVEWRRELRFGVERPDFRPRTVREEVAEARQGRQLATALRAAAASLARGEVSGAEPGAWDAPLLSAEHGAALLEVAARRGYPPQAPVAVAVAINRDELVGRSGLSERERATRERFAERAWNEERLVAAGAVLRSLEGGRTVRLSLIEMQAATFLRVWNQEVPWLPGDAGPAAKDVEARFGLASLRFDDDVPAAWQPYYLRMLARGLADLQHVLPTASVRGLAIRVGETPGTAEALALHEPGSRTLYLPVATGAGTLAHEIAHDLDWQLARRRYRRHGAYGTDLAVRAARGDRIAAAMMTLSASLAPGRSDEPAPAHQVRPAEVFARGMDWFVSSALARDGRYGGYLSSFRDPLLTGYGSTRDPDIGGAAMPALLAILDDVAPVPEETRRWAMANLGPSRGLSPTELVRGVLSAGTDLPAAERLGAVVRAGESAAASVDGLACKLTSAADLRRLHGAQRELLAASVEAAARGAAVDEIRALARDHAGAPGVVMADRWIAVGSFGGPAPADSVVQALVPVFQDLLYRAGEVRLAEPAASDAFRIGTTPSLCGGNPFAASAPQRRIPR